MSTKPTIIAVDLSAIYYQAYHVTANDQVSVSEQYRRTMVATLSKVNHIRTLDMGAADPRVVICCDDKKNWRKDIDHSYKAQRERQDAGFYDALERTKERLAKDGMPVLQAEGFEADDVIASLVAECSAKGFDVIVASPDKDLLQLVSDVEPRVRQLRTHKMFLDDDVTVKLYDEAMVKAEFGVPPSKFADYLALVGDTSDNVIGINGVGGKAAPLILEHFGSLNGLLSAVENRDEYKSADPWLNSKTLNRCASALTKYFTPIDSDKAFVQISNLSRNRILVGLKAEVPIDMEDILRERKVEKLSTNDDGYELCAGPGGSMDIAGCGPSFEAKYAEPLTQASDIANAKQQRLPTEPTPPKEIATRSVAMTQFNQDLQPTGMEALYWLAKRAADSRMYLKKFASEDVCLMAMLRGKDYGLSPTAALEILHVIEGKVCLPVHFMVSLARRHPDCEYIDVVESDEKHCKVATKRKSGDKVFEVDFQFGEAVQAGIVKPGGAWLKYPIDMCYARAMSRLCRRVWSEAMNGSYSIEEMLDA